MDVSRRSFLGGALAVAGASIIPLGMTKAADVPRIVGDGFHDDWAGLQAAFDGKPFVCEGAYTRVIGGKIVMRGGHYRVTRPLLIDCKKCDVDMKHCHIDGSEIPQPEPAVVTFENANPENVHVSNIICTRYQPGHMARLS